MIDHHEINKEVAESGNIIKTPVHDPTSLVMYSLAEKNLDMKKWIWLVCSSIISDIGYKKKENLEFLKKYYTIYDSDDDTISKSVPGKVSNTIGGSIIKHYNNLEIAYNLVKQKKLDIMKKDDIEVRKEVKHCIKKYQEEATYYPDVKTYYYFHNPRFNICSPVITRVSFKEPDKTFLLAHDSSLEFVTISARNQSKKVSMIELLKKGIAGFNNAIAGGHIPAAGASFQKKDLEKFKERVLKSKHLNM